MDGLRWLLLFVGILVIAGVYVYSRRERDRPANESQDVPRVTPTLDFESIDAEDVPPDVVASDSAGDSTEDSSEDQQGAAPQKIVTLRLIARDGGAFRGDDLILSLRGIGLRHGKFGIFHRYDGNDEKRTIFSAASLVEPGSFDLANIKEQEIMEASRAVAQALNAELLDESGSTLSIQRERYMREEVIQYQHSNLVA